MQLPEQHKIQLQKTNVIAQLRKQICAMQGSPRLTTGEPVQIKLGPINESFPSNCFPLAATHEFLNENPEMKAATMGFISCLLSSLMSSGGISVWISSARTVFPPALKAFGLNPDKIIFIDVLHDRDKRWVIEEALKCEGLAAVIGELKDLSFTTSRRWQLAVEQSRVTGFIIRNITSSPGINTCLSRWKILPSASHVENDLPGIGFPRWNIELLKIRNGKPGKWEMEWSGGRLQPVLPPVTIIPGKEKRKAV